MFEHTNAFLHKRSTVKIVLVSADCSCQKENVIKFIERPNKAQQKQNA